MKIYTPDDLKNMTDEERKLVLSGDFGRAFHESIVKHVTWIFWSKETSAATELLGQASAFILDGGSGKFLVTAAHVHHQYVKDFEEHGKLHCQVANAGVRDLRTYLIACGNKELGPDIATFRLSEHAVMSIGKTPITAPNGDWSPGPDYERAVMIAGFPGSERIVNKPDEISFGLYTAMPAITSYTDQQVTCRFDRTSMMDNLGLGLPNPGYNLGGLSGGPLLIPDFVYNKWIWRLGGVISQAPDEKPAHEVMFESIVADRAEYILPDGRLAKTL